MHFILLLLLLVLKSANGSYIVGGRNVVPHSRPYMASLQLGRQLYCGGILVREDFVLTAAHCRIPGPYTVVLGSDSLTNYESTKQIFKSVRYFQHPDYDQHDNDIMLIKLNGTAKLTQAVQLIALKSGILNSYSKCITIGWGDIGDNGTLSSRLQEVNVTILKQRTCARRWRGVLITDTMVCSVGAHSFQGFCSGDSGGPLVCGGEAAGVVSFSGKRCGDPRTPDVYMRISSYNAWIMDVLNNN